MNTQIVRIPMWKAFLAVNLILGFYFNIIFSFLLRFHQLFSLFFCINKEFPQIFCKMRQDMYKQTEINADNSTF